ILDANMDGKISKAELKGGNTGPVPMLKKYFDLIDANHDGFLDAKEMEAAAKLMSRGRGGQQAQAPKAEPAPAVTTPTAGGRCARPLQRTFEMASPAADRSRGFP